MEKGHCKLFNNVRVYLFSIILKLFLGISVLFFRKSSIGTFKIRIWETIFSINISFGFILLQYCCPTANFDNSMILIILSFFFCFIGRYKPFYHMIYFCNLNIKFFKPKSQPYEKCTIWCKFLISRKTTFIPKIFRPHCII